jgi:hypothetical protein
MCKVVDDVDVDVDEDVVDAPDDKGIRVQMADRCDDDDDDDDDEPDDDDDDDDDDVSS